jgi:hypothetical protein
VSFGLISGAQKNPSSTSGYITLSNTQAALGNTPTTSTGYTIITVNSQTSYANSLGRINFTFTNTASFIESNITNGNVVYNPNGTGSLTLNGPVYIPNLQTSSGFKGPVKVATTSDVTLIGGAPNAVDGVSLLVNDRILVLDQITPSQNGIYVVSYLGVGSNGTWVRSTDAQTSDKLANAIVNVEYGSTHGGKYYYTTFTPSNVIDVDPDYWYEIITDTLPQSLKNKSIDASPIGLNSASVATFVNTLITGGAQSYDINSGDLQVYGGTGIRENLNVGGQTNILNITSATSSFTGALIVAGGVGVAGDIYANHFYSNGVPLNNLYWNGGNITSALNIQNPSESTNTYSGALIVLGGAGIGQSLYVGKKIVVESRVVTDSVSITMRNTATNGQSYTWNVGGNNAAGQGGTALNEGSLTLYSDTAKTYRLAVSKTTGNLLVGQQYDNGVDKLQVAGSIQYGSANLFTQVTSINNTSTTVIDSFSAASYRTAKSLVQIASGIGPTASFNVIEVVVLLDNIGNVYLSEYGIITTGAGEMGKFDADYNVGGNGLVRLLFTPASASNKTITVARQSVSR